MRPAKVCPRSGCPHLTPCPDHPVIAWSRQSERNRLKPRDATRTRNAVIKRDKGICYVCGTSGATEHEHIKPVAVGGSWNEENSAMIHKHCHKTKTQADRRKFG